MNLLKLVHEALGFASRTTYKTFSPSPSVDCEINVNTKYARTTEELLEQIGGFRNPFTSYVVIAMSILWTMTAIPVMAPAFLAPFERAQSDAPFWTVQDEFKLEKSWINPAEWTGSSLFLGNMVAGQIFAALTDRYGRRPVIVYSFFLSGCAGVFVALAPTFNHMLLGRFIQGMFYTPSFVSNWVFACECIPFSSHATASIVFGIMWVLGYCLVSPMAMIWTDWRSLLMASAISNVAFAVVLYFTLPETPSFLALRRKEKELAAYVERATTCCTNKRVDYDLKAVLDSEKSNLPSNCTIWTMIRRTLRSDILHLMIISSCVWIIDYMVYNGLSYSSTALNVGNNHANYIFSGLVEIPAYIISPMMLDRMGRRLTVCYLHLLAAITLGLMCFIGSETPTPYLVVWMIAKFACASVFQCLFVYGAEIFSTEYRNFALGVCCTLSNIGAILSPHTQYLNKIHPSMMHFTFATLCLVAGFLTLCLPETMHSHAKHEEPKEEN